MKKNIVIDCEKSPITTVPSARKMCWASWPGAAMNPARLVAMSPAIVSSVVINRNCAMLIFSPTMATYRESGVNIDAQDEALREVRRIARGTFTPDVVSDIGLFGGLFRANFEDIEKAILVSSTDGVGTKLRVAQAMNIHD